MAVSGSNDFELDVAMKKKSFAKGGNAMKKMMGGGMNNMKPKRMMGGGMNMKKKNFALGGKVIKGPYS